MRFWIQTLLILALVRTCSCYQSVDLFERTCVFVTANCDTISPRGSGFLVHYPDSSNAYNDRVFLITCAHLINASCCSDISLRFSVQNRSDSLFSIRQINCVIRDSLNVLDSRVAIHPKYDVTAIDITDLILNDSLKISARWIQTSLFLPYDSLREWGTTSGDDILMMGYPSAIYDSTNAFPLVRHGVLSSNPGRKYHFNKEMQRNFGLPDSLNGFLIDTEVFPGSSGSLVILRPDVDPFLSRSRPWKYLPIPIGMVFGSIPIYDEKLNSRQRMGLGLVVSNEIILETILMH
jgi:hypothetical protein